MAKQIEKIKHWIIAEPPDLETQKTSIDIAVERTVTWLLGNLVPILLISLIIDVTIIFITPVDLSTSRWLWLKAPISIGLAYLICRLFRSIRRQLS